MQNDSRAPYTHGMEIEQFPNEIPSDVRNIVMSNHEGDINGWHNDASGPRETSLGPAKNVKSILSTFLDETAGRGITWDWHASNGSSGAGSHVHLCMEEGVFEDPMEGWTITYNTAVELFPFLAPYFCHNWQDGFRDGTHQGYGGGLNINKWAEGQTTRYSQASIESYVENEHGYSRTYESVTFNSADSSKPVTVELRANDAHPAMALNGLLLLRRVAGCAVQAGWSPKLENHRATLNKVYEAVYETPCETEAGLMEAMQQPIEGGITFKPGRGIPGVEQEHFETPFEVLKAIQSAYPQTPGSWRRRGEILVASADDAHSPHENTDALWNIDADVGEFTWDNGPDVGEEPDVERAAPTDGIRDLKGVGEGRATALEAAGFLTPAHIRQATTDDLTTADTVGRNTARELMAQVEGVRFNTEGDTQAEAEA